MCQAHPKHPEVQMPVFCVPCFCDQDLQEETVEDASCADFLPHPHHNLVAFSGMPEAEIPLRRPKTGLLDKVVFVIAMALNYWHFGGKFVEAQKLQRGLNAQHAKFVRYLKALVKSDDPGVSFPIRGAGRRFPELVARLSELTDFVTASGIIHDPYTKTFAGCGDTVAPDNSVMPELEPYRDLDAERLKPTGRGAWDMTEFLQDELVMVYRDPRVLEFKAKPSNCPIIRGSQEEIFKLAKRWDDQGILVAHFDSRGVEKPGELVRIFNAYNYKSKDSDRQIGDRRGRNSRLS